jgi:3',5'-cyclic AMP phosphodiesterase CpdA
MVFMTDIHWQQRHGAPQALAKALASLGDLDPAPELIVNGGDLVHNVKGMTPEAGHRAADRFLSLWQQHTDLPTHHALGNHDPLGWENPEVSPDEPLFGWDLWREKLGRDRLYYSFDHGGWHFVVLHNIALTERGDYIGEFDDEQMRWLKRDLARAGDRPTMLFGHMPPVSAIEFLDGGAEVEDGDWSLSITRMTRNPQSLMQAIEGSRAQAFWSGHIHRRDRIDALGLSMICAGAISGAWWGGANGPTQEGYAVIDCHPDGSFDYYYHDYGWQPPD